MQPYFPINASAADAIVSFYFSGPANGAVISVSKESGPYGLYPISTAETCFGISKKDLSQIPMMPSSPIFPGKYLQDRWVRVRVRVRGIAKDSDLLA